MRQNFAGNLSPLPPKMYSAPNIPQDVACYRILKPCYLDDQYLFEGEIVTWAEEPNKEMEPLNSLAKAAINAFFDETDRLGKLASAEKNRKYVPMRRPIEEEKTLNTAEGRRVEVVKGDGGIPIMGSKKRGRPRLSKMEASPFEEKPIANLAREANKSKHLGID